MEESFKEPQLYHPLSSSVDQTPRPRQSHFLILGASAVILVALGLLMGYLLWGNKTQSVPTQQQIAAAKPTPTHDPTANWQLYSNIVNHYTVKIPKDWQVDDKTGVFIGIPGEVVFIPPDQVNVPVGQTSIRITVSGTNKTNRYPLSSSVQFNSWLAKPISQGEGEHMYKTANLKIDGIDAVQYVNRTLPGDQTESFYSVITWFRKNGYNYNIELGGDEKIVKDNLSVYNKLLSTFKFSDQSQAVDTTKWKTYNNPLFTLKYPQNWKTMKSNSASGIVMLYDPQSMETVSGNGGSTIMRPTKYIDIQSVEKSSQNAYQVVQEYTDGWKKNNVTIASEDASGDGVDLEMYDDAGEGSYGRNLAISNGSILAQLNTSAKTLKGNAIENYIIGTFKFTQ